MKIASALCMVILLATACTNVAAEDRSPCTPLNATLSVCNDIPGISVSLVDATPGAVLGIAKVSERDKLSYVFNIAWNTSVPLEQYAQSHAQGLASGYALQKPVSVTVEGKPAIRYDFAPLSGHAANTGPKVALFIDTGAGLATFISSTGKPGITPEELYRGAVKAARILRIGQ